MNNKNAYAVFEALESRGKLHSKGKGWETRCPVPDHEDRKPSFFLYPGGGGKCYTQCGRYWSAYELADLLEIKLPAQDVGISTAELATAKGLSEDFLQRHGVSDGFNGSGKQRRPCVDVQYSNKSGEVVAVRKRLNLDGPIRFKWRRGDHPPLYGLPYLEEVRSIGWVILLEGESDCWTLWRHQIPALGVPGASMWKSEYAALLEGVEVYLWHEPDGGGDGLLKAISVDLPELKLIEAPQGAKDPSELYMQIGDDFKPAMDELLATARPVKDIRVEAFTKEARKCLEQAKVLLDDPDLILKISEAITISGYAGDTKPPIMTYVGLTSRLSDAPLNISYISASASGKNAACDAARPFVPDDAYYLVRASSPRALVYNDEEYTHRVVIFTEADSLPEDGPAASAMRSLMSDGEMSYEVTEKGEDGQHHARKIVKKGPTGLITTSTKPLGDQASTRTLMVTISDSEEQTRAVLHAHARRADEGVPVVDYGPWHAVQRWLELAGERRVVIPFAHALANIVPAKAVRMRRDFHQLLTVIQTLAMLHQRIREKDDQGQIIATVDDYDEARWLLEEVFATAVSDGVTPAIRGTVEAVSRLSLSGEPVMNSQLMTELSLSKGGISYRVGQALKGGWLVNHTTVKNAPAQLVLGEPLPDGNPLPYPDELVCVENPENESNLRTVPEINQGSNGGSNEDITPIAPDPGVESSDIDQGFEGFEPIPGAITHTSTLEGGHERELPWDAFLDQEKDNEPNVN